MMEIVSGEFTLKIEDQRLLLYKAGFDDPIDVTEVLEWIWLNTF